MSSSSSFSSFGFIGRAALGACLATTVVACAPTAPTRADAPKATATPSAAAASAPAAAAAPPAAWPSTARSLSGDELRQRVSGKVFEIALEPGMSARMDYRDSGYMFVNVHPSGASDSGRWRIDGNQLCSEMRRFPSGCNEMRVVGDKLMLRRTNGQIVMLEGR